MPKAGSNNPVDPMQRQAQAWSNAFAESAQFIPLTADERRWSEEIILGFVHMMREMHGRPPRRWSAQSVIACCTETMPARVVAPPGYFQALIPVLVGFVAFLATIGALTNGPALERALRRIQRQVPSRADDPTCWTPTKRLLVSAAKRDVDPNDPRAMEAFIDQVNAGKIPEVLPLVEVGEKASQPVAANSEEGEPNADGRDPTPLRLLRALVDAIARDLAKGRAPGVSGPLTALLEQHPELLLEVLSPLVTCVEKKEEKGEVLLQAWVAVLGFHLEQIRYEVDGGFTWARELIATFQARLQRMARAGSLPLVLLDMIIGLLNDAGLQPEPELLKLYEEAAADKVNSDRVPSLHELEGMATALFDEVGDDPFAVYEQIDHVLRTVPAPGRQLLLQQMSRSTNPAVVAAVALFVLHPRAPLRQAAREVLAATSLSPDTLRRLIVLRNWLPANEREPLDQAIRSARRRGVVCAPWPKGETVVDRYVSAMDGVGAMGCLLISTAESGEQRLVSVLAKYARGIADAWCDELIPASAMRRELRHGVLRDENIKMVADSLPTLLIKHHLHLGLAKGNLAPVGLLQVAETIAASDWHPEPLDIAGQLQAIREATADDTTPEARIIESSHVWSQKLPITDSWYAESQALTDYLRGRRDRRHEELVADVIKEFFDPERAEWIERLTWTALWLQNRLPGKKKERLPPARHFAILAQHLLRDNPLEGVPLMQLLAERSIEVERQSHRRG
ncbi:MAG: hypothetical protein HQL66_08900 [Magnetococcales bacterium]|nr:hypothetical protein [Magnetococcales bacterium]